MGFQWTLANARGSAQDIRTWGQLGLPGTWAEQPIATHGHAPSGTTRFFQLHVLRNSDKWNPNYRGYVETGSKMIADAGRAQQQGGIRHMLAHELAGNRCGIAWTLLPQAAGIPGIKPIAVAPRGGGPPVVTNRRTFQDRSYPLVRSIYIHLDRKPGTPVEPRLREFLAFILSREGQEIVMQHGGFLPLPAAMVAEEVRKLE